MPTIGFRTLDVGEQGLFYSHTGKGKVKEGPKRLFLFRQRLLKLQSYTADQNEYLIIKFRNGSVVHQNGPCRVFRNPLEHSQISVHSCVDLDANEVLVVYRQDEETKEVTRYLEFGPTRFIPGANEWVHTFKWHGTNPENKTQMLAGQNVFTKLQTIPGQFYYNVDQVRTADNALIRVKLMMFYELINIEQMLMTTQDPMADFMNCLCADVIAFCGNLTYMEFMERSGELNELENYPQLTERCKMIGYEVSKVVFRGYFASPKLQALHDNTITRRTNLKLRHENEEQNQIRKKKTLESEMKRITLEQSLDLEKLEHKHKMEKSQKSHTLEMEKNAWMERLQQMKAEEKNKLQGKMLTDSQEEEYLGKLKEMEVDVNSYVLSENPHPLKVVNVRAEKGVAKLHLHK